jgi:hypothetical protein
MIDGAMVKPFFTRNLDKMLIGLDSKASWNNENEKVVMINNYKSTIQVVNDNVNLDLQHNDLDNSIAEQ